MQRSLIYCLRSSRRSASSFAVQHTKLSGPLNRKLLKVSQTFDVPVYRTQVFPRTFTSSSVFQAERTFANIDNDVNYDKELINEKYYNHTDTGGLTATEYLNGLNEADAKKLKILKLEYEVLLASGNFIPENMSDEDWLKVWDCTGRSQRRRFYRYLAKIEKIDRKKEVQKEERRIKEEAHIARKQSQTRTEGEGQFVYGGESKNTILLRIQDKLINKHHARKCYESLLFGEKLVFDMSYDELMRPFDITNTVDQLLEAHGLNKTYPDPFYLYFCNAKPYGKFTKRLGRSTSGGYSDYPFTVTEQSYLDMFPKEDLVYLTPDAPDYLKEYDPYKTYIIGGLVDKVVTKPVTMAKAKREGIKMAKLPIDLHMRFIMGTKSLCLNQLMGIMCELKKTGDWRKAFKYIPRRKAVFLEEVEEYNRRSDIVRMRAEKRRAQKHGMDNWL